MLCNTGIGRFGAAASALLPIFFTILGLTAVPRSARAADSTWNNGSTNFTWDTSSVNWSTGVWNNAAGDGAIFGPLGLGAISLPGPISVNSLNFTVDGYSLNGVGPINIVNGVSTQTTGVVNVAAGATAKILVPINSSLGFQKIGEGTLELNSPSSFTGSIGLDGRNTLSAGLLIGGWFNPIPSGTLKVNSSSVIPSSTVASISDGFLDIGSNNVTLAGLVFPNQNDFVAWNPSINAAGCGVIGNGTLRVNGEINVIGVSGGNSGSNSIAANLDMGGGTQIVRVGSQNSFGLSASLQFTGSVSNGSLFKSIGTQSNGVQAAQDGMGLFGNNTYTGATILNMGENVVTGTNASTSVKIAGQPAAANTSTVKLQGANGSYQSATLLQAYAGGTFAIDNNAAIAAGGAQPPTPAAQNNNRIRDDAEVQLRDGNFIYRGLSTAAASETFGNLNVQGGNNVVTLTPNGAGGTVTVTASGNLSLAPRATMQVSSTTLGAASKMFVSGTLPAADATGILPRMVGSSDFLTYNGATGLTPYTGYAPDFNTPGTNVAVAAGSTVASSVNINALKRSGTFTTTIGAGQTLGITSGMILNTTGTGTYTGGTIAYGATPGVFFGGTNVVNSAITGSQGLINANSTLTLNGDLSGLTGTITNDNPATTNLATNTFPGSLEVRGGTLNINTSQTLAGQGPITIGVPQNDANMVGLLPSLNISGAGANAVIGRDIIVDNGSTNAAGATLRYNLVPGLSPLSNTTGSQTLSGNVTLNTSLRLQGGGAGGSGSTNFTGNISGPGTIHVPNGRANFSGTVSNAGGFNLGDQGFSMKVTFSGTGAGNGPITISGGNTNTVSYSAGALPGGPISVWNSSSGTQPQIIPLNNSTINNAIILGIGPNPGQEGNATANVGAGIVAEWAGPLSGFSPLTKIGTGTLILSNAANPHTGTVAVSAGTLQVDGTLLSSAISVANLATLKGTGSIANAVTVASGGTIAPGNSIGTLTTGALSLLGALNSEIDLNNGGPLFADLLDVNGGVSLTSAALNLLLLNGPTPPPYFNGTFVLVDNDGIDPVSGTFASITGLPGGYSATVDYAFSGTDSTGRTGDGNDIAVTILPEPATLLLLSIVGAVRFGRRR